jgi:hypothetical protein
MRRPCSRLIIQVTLLLLLLPLLLLLLLLLPPPPLPLLLLPPPLLLLPLLLSNQTLRSFQCCLMTAAVLLSVQAKWAATRSPQSSSVTFRPPAV